MKKLALIGCGYWGKNIARNLYELGVLEIICDKDNNILEFLADKYPKTKITTSIEDVLNSKNIDAVVIATPPATHYDIVKKGINSGKDIFVEKPLALNANEGRELRDLALNNNKILMVGHILHYHPAVKKLKELIKKGSLGKLEYIYSNRLNIGKLRTEENILWSFAPHDISVILSLVEDEPIEIKASGGCYLNKAIYDTTMTAISFKNGVKSHIFVSWLHPYKEQKLVVVGSKAMAVFDDMSKEKLCLYEHKIEWVNGKIPVAQKVPHKVISIEDSEPLKEELTHFLKCVEIRQKPLTDADEALKVLEVLEKAEDLLKILPVNGIEYNEGASPVKERRFEFPVIARRPEGPTKQPQYYAHETAVIDQNVKIGKNTKIWHFSHILKNSRIGKNVIIGQNVSIGPDVVIGNNVKIQNNVSVYKGVTLEDDVFCGPSAVFTNVTNPRAFIERKNEFKKTIVRKGATIGANATIICGNEIGKYALVAAGAVVSKNVPSYAIYAGVPAKAKGWVCRCGSPLKKFKESKAVCLSCGNCYSKHSDRLEVVKEN